MQRTPPELRSAARALRREATPAERSLWSVLRNHQPRFTRQLVVSHSIIDIACRSLKLAIELDASHHDEQVEADQERTAYRVSDDCRCGLAGVHPPRPLPFREGR